MNEILMLNGSGEKQAKTTVFFAWNIFGAKYFELHLYWSKLFFSVSTPCLPLVAAEAGAGQPPTASNNNGEPSMGCRIVLAKHSLFDIHCGMFLSLRYILIVKYTTLIFQSGPGNGEQIWQPPLLASLTNILQINTVYKSNIDEWPLCIEIWTWVIVLGIWFLIGHGLHKVNNAHHSLISESRKNPREESEKWELT